MSYNLERKYYFNICLEQEIKISCSKGHIFENRGSTYIIYVQIYDIHSYINTSSVPKRMQISLSEESNNFKFDQIYTK